MVKKNAHIAKQYPWFEMSPFGSSYNIGIYKSKSDSQSFTCHNDVSGVRNMSLNPDLFPLILLWKSNIKV